MNEQANEARYDHESRQWIDETGQVVTDLEPWSASLYGPDEDA